MLPNVPHPWLEHLSHTWNSKDVTEKNYRCTEGLQFGNELDWEFAIQSPNVLHIQPVIPLHITTTNMQTKVLRETRKNEWWGSDGLFPTPPVVAKQPWRTAGGGGGVAREPHT